MHNFRFFQPSVHTTLFPMFEKKKMDELHRRSPGEALASARHPIIIILDDVRSMHNVGSVFRTADAFAVTSIFLCGYTPTPPHRDIHKTALGATETVPWQHFRQVEDAIAEASRLNYSVITVEQTHASVSLENYSWTREPVALVFGNEVQGVSEAALQKASANIEIPQWGAKHSLNISVSVGVVLWELVRRLAMA
jgi:23S rRNA (guanosine2251-2'-O)-methyltransferase